MKSTSPTRPYRMGARADAAARTAQAILDATVALWRERPIEEITLEAIAERAGVSMRTVLRRFGSRDGVIAATIEQNAAAITAERDRATADDLDGALDLLLAHYERDGEPVLRTLALEATIPAARAIVEAGRAAHRAWCERIFAPHLPPPGHPARDVRLDAFVAATDLYLWKLLRLDLGRPADETRAALRALVDGLIHLPHP